MTSFISKNYKVQVMSVLDRAQAFEICGRGPDHIEFAKSLLDEVRRLYACVADGEASVIQEKAGELNKLLDTKFLTYDNQVKLNIIEFIRYRQPQFDIEEQLSALSSVLLSRADSQEKLLKSMELKLDQTVTVRTNTRKTGSEEPEYLRILECIKQKGPVSVEDVALHCGVTSACVNSIRKEAVLKGHIIEKDSKHRLSFKK